jgi:uncharacterized protein YbjQ (UPF0145 family)
MLITTTESNMNVLAYHGVVNGTAVSGVNVIKDIMGGIRDIVGGYSITLENSMSRAQGRATEKMVEDSKSRHPSADAIIGVSFTPAIIGDTGSMIGMNASGTAVTLGIADVAQVPAQIPAQVPAQGPTQVGGKNPRRPCANTPKPQKAPKAPKSPKTQNVRRTLKK